MIGKIIAASPRYRAECNAQRIKLKEKFDAFCELTDSHLIKKAKELVSQEGIIDAEIEGLSGKENQRDLSIKFRWGHNHNFGNGFSVRGRMGDRHINLVAEFMTGFDLTDSFFEAKDCIDVGSWTGGTTLMLKCLGADKVFALEEVKKYALATMSLCKDVYGLDNVISDGVNLYDFKSDQKYDVAYFPGVVYHLSDPVLGLRRLYNALNENGICLVETAGIDSSYSIARFDGNRIYHNSDNETAEKLNRGGWNWYIPSPLCLERWMVEAGFEEVKTYFSYASNRVYGYGVKRKYNDICRAGFSIFDIE